MRFASLGSGSRGNALVVSHEKTHLLIDCGLPFKTIKSRLEELNLRPNDLDAVFVTHEHGDHIGGLATLDRKTDLDIFMSEGTAYESGWHESPSVEFIRDGELKDYGPFQIEPVIVPHDAREPCQFVVTARGYRQSETRRLGVLTDLGSDSAHVVEAYQDCDALVLECNHDVDLLQQGSYPPTLKARVGGDWGHLNNEQAASLLEKIRSIELQWLALAHISEQNNSIEIATDTIKQVFVEQHRTVVAKQVGGFDWLDIE